MKEAYVSYEVAKLLKEKGFDWECRAYWHEDDRELIESQSPCYLRNITNPCWFGNTAPTQQMACRWLREEHNILVAVQPCEVGPGVDDYTYVIYEIQPEDYHFKFIEQGRMQPVAYTMDYEGTLEEGIKHALTNLI